MPFAKGCCVVAMAFQNLCHCDSMAVGGNGNVDCFVKSLQFQCLLFLHMQQ